MQTEIIILTGTSGAGKSAITQKLCEEHEEFEIAQAITTREKRKDDKLGQYQYVTDKEFQKLDKRGKLLVRSEYRGRYYGITYEALRNVVVEGKTPILVITPESVKELKDENNKEHWTFFTIFFDAPDDILDKRLEERGEKSQGAMEQRKVDREHSAVCLYTAKNMYLEKTIELVWSLWNYRKTGGVLSKRLIQLMIECGMLLENANLQNIEGASYDLTLDDEYYHKGKTKTLNDKDSFIKMEPGDYVLIGSKEIARFPNDIAGRFGLSVSLFFLGIILSNGPQVDPGFGGRLYCLLFNTSNEEVQLKRGQHYATVEFLKLIEPTTAYTGQYQGKDRITQYLPRSIESSAISELRKDVKSLKSERLWVKMLPLIISLLAILLAFLSLLPELKKIILGIP